MAVHMIDNMPLWLGGYDLTSDTNEFNVGEAERTVLDKTNMGSLGWFEGLLGLGNAKLSAQTFLNTENAANFQAQALGATHPITAVKSSSTTPGAGAVGDPCVFTNAMVNKISEPAKVGDIAMLNMEMETKGPEPIVVGQLLLPRTLTGTGANGTSVTLGAVSSTKKVYAALHVFGVSGSSTPTLLCKVQSAPLSNFASPTDRITFTNSTAVGSELKSTAGAITDTFWRVVYSFTGTSPVFYFAVAAGIA